ncbi:MAG: phosphatase PAP2 family protein [Halodesulfurarchaeum sp.]
MRNWGVTEALAPAVPDPLVGLLVTLTALGDPTLLAAVSIAGSAGALTLGRVEFARVRRFLVAVALVLSVSILLKHGFSLPRPPDSLMLIPTGGYGFPSGHATATAGFVTALLGGRKPPARWHYAIGALAVAVIAATRVLLGVHYLPDVLAGIAVGVAVASAGRWAARVRPRLTLVGTVGTVAIAIPIWLLG